MGYWIGCREEVVWEPSLTIGILFLSEIRALEGVFKMHSGFVEEASDMFDIEKEDFIIFLLKLSEFYKNNSNEVLKRQLLPTLSMLFELLKRIDAERAEKIAISSDVQELAKTLSKHMPD